MIHDLVIRLISKYLYRDNRTLVNLHLVSKRFYKIREIFVKEITYVRMEFKFDYVFEDIVDYIVLTAIAPMMHHKRILYKPRQNYPKQWFIDWYWEILSPKTKYIELRGALTFHSDTYLLKSLYAKSFAECISVIVADPRCWVTE